MASSARWATRRRGATKEGSLLRFSLLFVVLALLVAACGGDDDDDAGGSTDDGGADTTVATTEAAGGEEVTISLAALSSYKTGLDEVIANFMEANPGVTVEATYYEAGDVYTTTIPTQFAGGNGSDIVFVLGGTARSYAVAPFAEEGYLEDLSAEPWVDSMYEPTKSLYVYDGMVMARDLGLAPLSVVSYNRDFFDENQLPIPTTMPELIELCGTINDLGITPIAWGAGNPAVNANNLATLAAGPVFASDPDWMAKRANGEVTFSDSPEWRESVQQLADMIDAGCFSEGAAGAAIADMVTMFATGESAMMYTSGILNGQVLDQTPDLNIGLIPPPAPSVGDTRVMLQGGGGLALWTGSENQDVARSFLIFISESDQALAFASASQLIAPEQAAAGELPGLYGDLKQYFDNDQAIPDITATWPNTEMNSMLGDSVQGLFTGQKTVDDILADMDDFYGRS